MKRILMLVTCLISTVIYAKEHDDCKAMPGIWRGTFQLNSSCTWDVKLEAKNSSDNKILIHTIYSKGTCSWFPRQVSFVGNGTCIQGQTIIYSTGHVTQADIYKDGTMKLVADTGETVTLFKWD